MENIKRYDKENLKKILNTLVILLLIFSSYCGNNKKESSISDKTKIAEMSSIPEKITSEEYCTKAIPITISEDLFFDKLKKYKFTYEESAKPFWCESWQLKRLFKSSKKKKNGKIVGAGLHFAIRRNENSNIMNLKMPLGQRKTDRTELPDDKDSQNELLGENAKYIMSSLNPWVIEFLNIIVPEQSDSVIAKLKQFSSMTVQDLIKIRYIDPYGRDSFEGFYQSPGWTTVFYIDDFSFTVQYLHAEIINMTLTAQDVLRITIEKKSTFDLEQRIDFQIKNYGI